MILVERLASDLVQAMKGKDKLRVSVIRMVRAAMKNKEIESGSPIDDDDALVVIQKELKQRRDSLQAFESAGRTDLISQVKDEIAILESYLPEPFTENEVRALAEAAIQSVGATGKSDMGKVMAVLMPQLRGRAEGRMVQQVVQSML